jgi:hypothetical protein
MGTNAQRPSRFANFDQHPIFVRTFRRSVSPYTWTTVVRREKTDKGLGVWSDIPRNLFFLAVDGKNRHNLETSVTATGDVRIRSKIAFRSAVIL